jgi:hypothetical protein
MDLWADKRTRTTSSVEYDQICLLDLRQSLGVWADEEKRRGREAEEESARASASSMSKSHSTPLLGRWSEGKRTKRRPFAIMTRRQTSERTLLMTLEAVKGRGSRSMRQQRRRRLQSE